MTARSNKSVKQSRSLNTPSRIRQLYDAINNLCALRARSLPLIRSAKRVENMKVVPITEKAPDGRLLSLTIGKEYEVLGIEADSYRILNDPETRPYGNDPVLFEPSCFRITEATEPAFWVCEYGTDGELYCYPPEWSQAGFFEDFHDGVEEVRKQFWTDLQRYFPETWKERNLQSLYHLGPR